MSELKKYEVRTASGYVTTIQYSDADAKMRGLLGKDVEAVRAAAQAEAKAKESKAKAARAAKEAKDAEAAIEAAKAQGTPPVTPVKGAPAPANKQASAPENK